MQDRSKPPSSFPSHGTVHASPGGAEAARWKDVAVRDEAPERGAHRSLGLRLAASWPYALLIAVGLFVLVPTLGDFGFWDPWEPKYAESAREMRERGDYVVPYYRGEVRLTKPILVYWGILVGSAVFGLNEFGARAAGVGLAIASICLVYYAVATLRGRKAGLFAALVLVTAPHFYFIARQAMPDVYLFTTMGGSLLLFAIGLYGPARRRTLHFAASYAAFALAVLAKGPLVAGVIFFGTLAVHALAVADLSVLKRKEVRGQALRFYVTSFVGFAIGLAGLATAYVFGTSSMWWGYAAAQRLVVDDTRRAFLGAMNRSHGQAILLVLFGIGFVLAAIQLWRKSAERRGKILAGLAAAAAIAAFAGLALDGERQLVLAGVLAAALCTTAVVRALMRLLRIPAIREATEPWRAPLGKQVLLFAVITLVVAGPWHVAILIDQHHGFVTDFIIKHNINRAVEDVNSTGISDFYLRTMTWAYFPWSALIPVMLAGLLAWSDREVFRRQGFEAYLLISSLVIFVAFTCSVTKFNHYLAPMLLPMAVLIGITLARLSERTLSWARLGWLVAGMLFLLPALDLIRQGGVRYLVNTFTVKRWVPHELEPGGFVIGLVVLFGLLMFVNAFLRSTWVVAGMLALSVLFAHHYTTYFIPKLSEHKSLKGLVATYHRFREPGEPLGFNGDLKHGIFFYAGNDVDLLPDSSALFKFMDPSRRAFTVIERANYLRVRDAFRRTYPDHDLYVIDDSHFDYHLITNLPLPEAGDFSRENQQIFIGREED